MHLPQGLEKWLKDHFGKLLKSTILFRRSFWKMFSFGKDMAIWSTMNEWCFFLYFYFSSFAYIFQDITMSWPAVLFLETAGHALSLKPLYDEIVKKKFWHCILKISTLRGSWIFFDNFSKKKNFFQIKIVKMQIDRYGPQKCCKLNRLKISKKLRLPWLFKVRRIMLKKS